MKKKYLSAILILIFMNAFAQKEGCGTMNNYIQALKANPELKQKREGIENQIQDYIQKNKNGLAHFYSNEEKAPKSENTQDALSLCAYNNTFNKSISAPTNINQIVSPSPNCTKGGQYNTITGLMAGNTYRISTCGTNAFDTQITIYPQGGGAAVAYNDDWCGTQSEIYFTPFVSGNYDVLINGINCTSNALCANFAIELWNKPRPKIVIPVVVHVMHSGEAIGIGKNISIEQINTQINVLNTDFRRMNTDIHSVGAPFRGASADPLIEFCLALKDTSGNPSTGITRHLTSTAQVTQNDMETSIKPATIWNSSHYLNIWTADFGAPNATLLGYAQFPGLPANTDGVVISYKTFGTIGSALAPFHLGRTTSHEVGHWLDLWHLFGEYNDCSGDDFISDTPNQEIGSLGVPLFPSYDACTSTYPGIMFTNYMDYSDDVALTMFTYGQCLRMEATLFGFRSNLQSSPTCASLVGLSEYDINKNSSVFSGSIRIYPNPADTKLFVSLGGDLTEPEIRLQDLMGRTLIKATKTNMIYELNCETINNGVYFLCLYAKGILIKTEKIIVQHS